MLLGRGLSTAPQKPKPGNGSALSKAKTSSDPRGHTNQRSPKSSRQHIQGPRGSAGLGSEHGIVITISTTAAELSREGSATAVVTTTGIGTLDMELIRASIQTPAWWRLLAEAAVCVAAQGALNNKKQPRRAV